MSRPLTVTQIVRRFGPVGGMESYVYELTRALLARGVRVNILCEEVHHSLGDTTIYQLDKTVKARPRWRAMLGFRDAVWQFLKTQPAGSMGVIHSHERSIQHHVTTFHGPPINGGFWFYLPKQLNRRIDAWRGMERAELLGDSVRCVVPVSNLIGDALIAEYPEVASRLLAPGWPAPGRAKPNPPQTGLAEDGRLTLGFVGREWKRKGLVKAHRITRALRHSGIEVRLVVVGSSQIPRYIQNDKSVVVVDWTPCVPFGEFDVLIHPATKEPYGMVIAEARAAGIPVVCSLQTGASAHGFENLEAIDVRAADRVWCEAVMSLSGCRSKPQYLTSWERLADQMIDQAYMPIWPDHDYSIKRVSRSIQ